MLRFLILCAFLITAFLVPAAGHAKPLRFAGPGEKCWFETSTQKTPTQTLVRRCGLGNSNIKNFCYWHCTSVRAGSGATCNNACRISSGGGSVAQPKAPRPAPSEPNAPGRSRRRGAASEAYCETNPHASGCEGSEAYCKGNPYASGCVGSEAYCKGNPYASGCEGSEAYCKGNPYASGCGGSEAYCRTNPHASGCEGSEAYCAGNPYSAGCRSSEAYCKTNPYSSDCR